MSISVCSKCGKRNRVDITKWRSGTTPICRICGTTLSLPNSVVPASTIDIFKTENVFRLTKQFIKKYDLRIPIALTIFIGFSLLAFEKPDKLSQIFSADFTIFNSGKESQPPKDENTFYYSGQQSIFKKDFDSAIAAFNEAIKLKPTYAQAFTARGFAWAEKGDLERAIADYNNSISLDPSNSGSYHARGLAWDKKGDPDKAITDFNKALILNPEYSAAFYNRGNAWYKKGNIPRALTDLNEAIRISPNWTPAFYRRGMIYEEKNDLTQALNDFRSFSTINPNDSEGTAAIQRIERKMAIHHSVVAQVNNAVLYIVCEMGDLNNRQSFPKQMRTFKIDERNQTVDDKKAILFSSDKIVYDVSGHGDTITTIDRIAAYVTISSPRIQVSVGGPCEMRATSKF
jgi:tetratricopeptide (TPR) repeat protein